MILCSIVLRLGLKPACSSARCSFRLLLKPVDDDYQHTLAEMANETNRPVVLAFAESPFFGRSMISDWVQ